MSTRSASPPPLGRLLDVRHKLLRVKRDLVVAVGLVVEQGDRRESGRAISSLLLLRLLCLDWLIVCNLGWLLRGWLLVLDLGLGLGGGCLLARGLSNYQNSVLVHA